VVASSEPHSATLARQHSQKYAPPTHPHPHPIPFSSHPPTRIVIRMEGVNPNTSSRILFSFRTPEEIRQYAVGSDADLGGNSSAHLDFHPDGYARFWGEMRLDVKAGLEGKLRAGYAGFRNKVRLLFCCWERVWI
jgi:hypothetical protein